MEPSKKDWKLYREKVPGWQELFHIFHAHSLAGKLYGAAH